MSDEEAAAYIAAFIDGEGHIKAKPIAGRECWSRGISTSNTDKSLVDAFVRLCGQLGFPTTVAYFPPPAKHPHYSPKWCINIRGGREAFERFKRIIPIQSERKRAALDALLLSYWEDPYRTRKRGERRKCETCSEMFYAPRQRVDNPLWGRFCSHACRGLQARKRESRACEVCGKITELCPSTLAQAKGRGRFCSLECRGWPRREARAS